MSRYDHARTRTLAAYAQDTVELSSRLKLVAGVRVDDLRRRTNNNPVADGIETAVPVVTRAARAVTGRVGVVFQPNDHVDVYGQHATAFRPNFNVQPDGTALDPETGRQLEVGQRLRLSGGRAELTTAVFDIEKRNIALARPGGAFDLAGRIRSRGLEVEALLRPTALSRVSAGYGYTRAVYDDYVTSAGDWSGRDRPRSPRHSLSLSGSAAFRSGLSLGFSANARSRQFLDDANLASFDAYGIASAFASYTRGRLQYGITVTNLTDTGYWASALGDSQLYPGEPLRATATIRVVGR